MSYRIRIVYVYLILYYGNTNLSVICHVKCHLLTKFCSGKRCPANM